MSKDKRKMILIIIVVTVCVLIFIRWRQSGNQPGIRTMTVNPVIGKVVMTVDTTGVIEPQNRLEIKPSISGRIDKILVKEGDDVKEGDILAWMSSTERAALVDAARSQSAEVLAYWEDVYKKTPIISPINGEVIVRSIEQGQTVTTQDAILVLSDRLVVSAQFDETDIGRIKLGQKTSIMLDAYPEVRIKGIVDHLAYESEIVNNVTIYDVDILPNEMPKFLRSGMSVMVQVIEKEKEGVLIISSNSIHYDGKKQFVMVKGKNGEREKRYIDTALTDGKNTEVISGLTESDNIFSIRDVYLTKEKSVGTNPFMPQRNRKK